MAESGGNAVDAALGAVMAAMVTEPGVCAPGSGGFITVGTPDGAVQVFDGYMEMPGRGVPAEEFGRGVTELTTSYGGGTTMLIGPGSIATPGAWAALEAASQRFGMLPWEAVMAPCRQAAADGFPLGTAAHSYLEQMDEAIAGDPAIGAALIQDGRLAEPGDRIVIPDLADSLAEIAERGAASLHGGSLGARISSSIRSRGGILSLEDLWSYRVAVRRALRSRVSSWELATNPAPSVGGAALIAMFGLISHDRPPDPEELVAAQRAVLGFRKEHVDGALDVTPAIRALLDSFPARGFSEAMGSPSTVHVSAVDRDGLACAVTLSAGYGAWMVPEGTGFWMNNSLGEIELNRAGLHTMTPGTRLLSNMAPTLARRDDGAVVAVGSPGADRITTALFSTLAALFLDGADLESAILRPRLHVELGNGNPRVAHEPGVDPERLGLPTRAFEGIHMFFGGVAAAARLPDGSLQAVADPRRQGGVVLV